VTAARWAGGRDGPGANPAQPDDPGRPLLRALLSPVVVLALVVLASVTELVGLRVQDAGGPQSVVNVVYDVAPQVMCLIATARVLAELAWRAPAEARWRRS
jgi:hypothetical protein